MNFIKEIQTKIVNLGTKSKRTSSIPVKEIRRRFIEKHIDISSSRILEIGALNDPTYEKVDSNILFMDWFSKEELHVKFKNNSPERVKNLVEVNFVVKEKHFEKCFKKKIDVIIANHVIEHIPDVISWIQSVSAILKDNGILFLSVPHKEYTFDKIRPLTTLGQLIENNDQDLERPTFKYVFDHIYLHRPIRSKDVWNDDYQDLMNRKRCSAKEAIFCTKTELSNKEDVHRNIFDYGSFVELCHNLFYSGFIDLKIIDAKDVEQPGNEFLIILKKHKQPSG